MLFAQDFHKAALLRQKALMEENGYSTGSGNHSREAELRRSCLPPTGGPFIKVEVAVVDKPFDRPAPKAPPPEVLLLALPDAAEQRHAVAVKKPPPTPAMMP